MKRIVCPTMLLHPDAKAPTRKSALAVGHDICCVGGLQGLQKPSNWSTVQQQDWNELKYQGSITLEPGESFLFRTGFAQAIDPDYACFLYDRSGLGAIKVVGRLAGVIDADYRGEWFVRLVNHSQEAVTIRNGDPIVQGVYQERTEADCRVVDELPTTDRGIKGFGSTDTPNPSERPTADESVPPQG